MKAISYLLSETLNIGLIALIILFQPELRRALEKIGSSTGLKQMFIREEALPAIEQAIKETVTACTEMSQSRTGVLLVFERENQLDDILRSGTKINADVSSELLKNIFWNKAPLHDGAALLRRQDLAFSAHFPGHEHALLAKQKYALTPFFPWPDRMEQGVYSVVTLNRHIKIAHEDST